MTQHHQGHDVISQSALLARVGEESGSRPKGIDAPALERERELPDARELLPWITVDGGHEAAVTLRLTTTQPALATQLG